MCFEASQELHLLRPGYAQFQLGSELLSSRLRVRTRPVVPVHAPTDIAIVDGWALSARSMPFLSFWVILDFFVKLFIEANLDL